MPSINYPRSVALQHHYYSNYIYCCPCCCCRRSVDVNQRTSEPKETPRPAREAKINRSLCRRHTIEMPVTSYNWRQSTSCTEIDGSSDGRTTTIIQSPSSSTLLPAPLQFKFNQTTGFTVVHTEQTLGDALRQSFHRSLLPGTRGKNERWVVINKRLCQGWINDKYEAGWDGSSEPKKNGGKINSTSNFSAIFHGKAAIRQSPLRYLINGYF